ncbi:MAG TPA: hypothetical protein VHR55_10505 [Candidatus Limnocylindria bacterium]|nr:hypothetical protein [Candidatus Limnocylindria bacterium]
MLDAIERFTESIVPSSMDGIVLLGIAAAAVAVTGTVTIVVIAIVAGVMRRWHR